MFFLFQKPSFFSSYFTCLIIDVAFLQFCHTVPKLSFAAGVIQPDWPGLVGEKLWLSRLNNNHVEKLLPVCSYYITHSYIPINQDISL